MKKKWQGGSQKKKITISESKSRLIQNERLNLVASTRSNLFKKLKILAIVGQNDDILIGIKQFAWNWFAYLVIQLLQAMIHQEFYFHYSYDLQRLHCFCQPHQKYLIYHYFWQFFYMKLREQIKDNRVYYGLLGRVGLQGNYQTNLMRIIYVIAAISGAAFNLVPFIFYQEPYQCDSLANMDGNCNQIVCSLPNSLRNQYLPEKAQIYSLASFYGDMHCERIGQLNVLKEFFLIGTPIGLFVGILFVEFLGRKRTICLALLTIILSILMLILIEPYYAKGIALFLWGGCAQLSYSILGAFITETTSQANRVTCYALMQLAYVFGCFLNICFFYLLRDWIWVLALYYLTTYLLTLIVFFYYVQSTPLELISNQTPQEAYRAFMRIAERNQIIDHKLSIQQIEQLQLQYKEQKKKKHDYRFNFFDLLRYPSIRSDFIKVGFLIFMLVFMTHGFTFILDQLSMNIFALNLMNVSAMVLVVPFFRQLLLGYPRKTSITVSLLLTSLFSFVVYGLAPNDCFKCKQGLVFIFLLIAFFLVRFFGHLASNMSQGPHYQSFPAQIRSIAVYSVTGVGRFANIVLPLLARIKDKFNIPLFFQFGVFAAIGAIGATFLRETFNILPEEIIEELRDTQKQNDNQC